MNLESSINEALRIHSLTVIREALSIVQNDVHKALKHSDVSASPSKLVEATEGTSERKRAKGRKPDINRTMEIHSYFQSHDWKETSKHFGIHFTSVYSHVNKARKYIAQGIASE